MKISRIQFLALLLIASNAMAQTPEQKFNTLKERVNSQGQNPGQTYSNLYTDKLTAFFYNNGWKDEVIPTSIKSIRVAPPDDPSDWYYFISVKSKNCSTPFYISYDIGDSNLGELFIIEPAGFPIEFKNFIAAEKKKESERLSAIKAKEIQDQAAELADAQAEREHNANLKHEAFLSIRSKLDSAISYNVKEDIALLVKQMTDSITKVSSNKTKAKYIEGMQNGQIYKDYVNQMNKPFDYDNLEQIFNVKFGASNDKTLALNYVINTVTKMLKNEITDNYLHILCGYIRESFDFKYSLAEPWTSKF